MVMGDLVREVDVAVVGGGPGGYSAAFRAAELGLEAVVREGQIVPRLMLPLSLTFDHRVADGVDGARFASDIVRRLEHPDQLLLGL